ncbi:hypothetical protein SAMN05216412_11336 [Nitrosospira multiformis]|uniref:Uncharacterized protein n=1 Tax=Nitrosospira multiformis TaxID=1231 RepID=A0A1I0GJ34_9PROT|nr:hypothetical protein SAMN05216412_11336 [Nitrosospira multiformis]
MRARDLLRRQSAWHVPRGDRRGSSWLLYAGKRWYFQRVQQDVKYPVAAFSSAEEWTGDGESEVGDVTLTFSTELFVFIYIGSGLGSFIGNEFKPEHTADIDSAFHTD